MSTEKQKIHTYQHFLFQFCDVATLAINYSQEDFTYQDLFIFHFCYVATLGIIHKKI
jgi:hypothetical protein